MTNTNKIIIVLLLVSLVITVIGSWVIWSELNDAELACKSCNAVNMASTEPIIRQSDSSIVTMTIAPAGPRNIASAKVLFNVESSN